MVGMGGRSNKSLRYTRHMLSVGTSRRVDRKDSQPHTYHRDLETSVSLSHQFPPLHFALLEERSANAPLLCHSIRRDCCHYSHTPN